MKFIFAVFIVFTFLVLEAEAWNGTGHMVVAELAWRGMSASHRHAISKLLKQHPHYQLLLAKDHPADCDLDEWVFLQAATWPDMIRPARAGDEEKPSGVTQFHRSQWHYINIPYVWPADAGGISTNGFNIPATNIVWALNNSAQMLGDKRLSAAERAVSLCWVLHLVGDIHQPLHAATLLTQAYPRGDMGGNALAIVEASGKPMNLHWFWDQLLDSGHTYTSISVLADTISGAPQNDPRRLAEYRSDKTAESWARESYRAAIAFAYADGQLKFADWKAFAAGSVAATEVPRLGSAYVINASDLAHRRVSLAGRRLRDLLERKL